MYFVFFYSTEPGLLLNPAYRELYEVIASSLQRGNFHTGADAQKRNILRIGEFEANSCIIVSI